MSRIDQRAEENSKHQGKLYTKMAETDAEVRAAQALRYQIFAEEMGATLHSDQPNLDQDHFDAQCEHMLVCESESNEIVGTTRILIRDESELNKPDDFYSQTEFLLHNILSLPGRKMEIGRTCIAAKYRKGGGIMTLWSGLCEFMFERDVDQLLGCASISIDDPQYDANEILGYIQLNHLSAHDKRVYPKKPWTSSQANVACRPPAMPPLLKGYLRLGAEVCGNACWDPDFNVVDVLILMEKNKIDARYLKHFRRAA